MSYNRTLGWGEDEHSMRRIADIAVYDLEGALVLAVEVNSRPSVSTEWASRTARNMFAHGVIPHSPYFMLALPYSFYLWDNRKRPLLARTTQDDEAPKPDYLIDAARALAPYLDDSSYPLSDLSEQGLLLLIEAWLDDLINSDFTKESAPSDLHWLFDSGLYVAIKKGYLATESVL